MCDRSVADAQKVQASGHFECGVPPAMCLRPPKHAVYCFKIELSCSFSYCWCQSWCQWWCQCWCRSVHACFIVHQHDHYCYHCEFAAFLTWPTLDAKCCAACRLQAAGAVLVAKLATGEMAYDDVWFDGFTKNPWNIAEGSSGSSAGVTADPSCTVNHTNFPVSGICFLPRQGSWVGPACLWALQQVGL